MNDDEKVMLVECDQRSKSAIYQISEIKDRLGKLEDKTEDIHRIATSIEVVCNDIGYIKQGQIDLTNKVDNLSEKVDKQNVEIKADVKSQINDIQKQIDTVDDEGKINIRVWIRDNWLSAVLAIGGVIAMFAYFQK
jgi:gas vesicle protein